MALGRRIDPNQPLDMKDSRVRGVLGEWVRARRDGGPTMAGAALQSQGLVAHSPQSFDQRPAPSRPAPRQACHPQALLSR